MGKVNYLLLDMSVLPEVYVKVIEAKGYLQSGEAANASQAVKMAGNLARHTINIRIKYLSTASRGMMPQQSMPSFRTMPEFSVRL